MNSVLVVDDDPLVRALIVEALRGEGLLVLQAGDGAEAVELCRRHRRGISLVLLDLLMPCMGGAEALVSMKAIDPELRVILMSGCAPGPVGELLDEPSVVDFIAKPFSLRQLVERVQLGLVLAASVRGGAA